MIEPETKNWTWVLEQQCPDCGLAAGTIPFTDVADLLRTDAARWQMLLASGAIRPGRPNDHTWSTLEYACHARDAIRTLDGRLALILAEDDPVFPYWDQDAAADADRYDEQDPAVVVTEIIEAEAAVATRLDTVADDQWARPGHRDDGVAFTVGGIAEYLVHETTHHAWDIEQAG